MKPDPLSLGLLLRYELRNPLTRTHRFDQLDDGSADAGQVDAALPQQRMRALGRSVLARSLQSRLCCSPAALHENAEDRGHGEHEQQAVAASKRADDDVVQRNSKALVFLVTKCVFDVEPARVQSNQAQ